MCTPRVLSRSAHRPDDREAPQASAPRSARLPCSGLCLEFSQESLASSRMSRSRPALLRRLLFSLLRELERRRTAGMANHRSTVSALQKAETPRQCIAHLPRTIDGFVSIDVVQTYVFTKPSRSDGLRLYKASPVCLRYGMVWWKLNELILFAFDGCLGAFSKSLFHLKSLTACQQFQPSGYLISSREFVVFLAASDGPSWLLPLSRGVYPLVDCFVSHTVKNPPV